MDSIDFTRYVWRNDDRKPGRIKREVGGGELIEDVWNFFKDGEQNLYLGLYTALTQPLDVSSFLDLLKMAWISTRWDIPTVAAQILHEPRKGSPVPAALLVYDLLSSDSAIESWAGETIIYKEGYKDLDALRYDIGQGLLPSKDLELQTFVYVLHFSDTEYGLLFRTSHVPFDGSGLKILGTRLLEHLSLYISDPSYASQEASRIKWGTEGDRLLPIASEVLTEYESQEIDGQGTIIKPEIPAERREGPEYFETLQKVMEGLTKGGTISHPFKSLMQPPYDATSQKPKTRRAFNTFTIEESNLIVSAVRNLSDKMTINHIVHGALCLLTLIDNPPAPNSPNVLFFYGLVDARNRLLKQYRGPEGYPGYCLAMSPIQIPVTIWDKYAATDGLGMDSKSAVLDLARTVKQEYRKQAALSGLLAIVNQEVELILSGPPPPPWCGPWFAGDGRGENYLRPKYPQSGPTVIEVGDFFLGLNKTDPGPFFRVTEWKGRIMLSADYNELAVEPSVVDDWMKKWAELILSSTT